MAKRPANSGDGKIAAVASKFPKFTRKQALFIVLVGAVVCGVAYVATHYPQSSTESEKQPAGVRAETGGSAQGQSGDGQQQRDGVQQRAGEGGRNINKVYNAPQPVKESAADRFRASLQSLSEDVGEQKRLLNERTAARSRMERSKGVLSGMDTFLATAVSVQTRFDEGEANRGRGIFLEQVKPVRDTASQSITSEEGALREIGQKLTAAQARIDSLIAEVASQLAEAKPEDQETITEAKTALATIKTKIPVILTVHDETDTAKSTGEFQSGYVAGASEHQQRFFDIMFGMDREEAQWSRLGGEERAPPGGYTRLVDEKLAAPRAAIKESEKRQSELAVSASQTAGTVTEAFANLRGLGRSLFTRNK